MGGYFKRNWETFPMEQLKRVDEPVWRYCIASIYGTQIQGCSWSKPYTPFHRAINWIMRNIKFARKFVIWGDDLLGYGKADHKNKWWFDLEDKNGDGILSVPKK